MDRFADHRILFFFYHQSLFLLRRSSDVVLSVYCVDLQRTCYGNCETFVIKSWFIVLEWSDLKERLFSAHFSLLRTLGKMSVLKQKYLVAFYFPFIRIVTHFAIYVHLVAIAWHKRGCEILIGVSTNIWIKRLLLNLVCLAYLFWEKSLWKQILI